VLTACPPTDALIDRKASVSRHFPRVTSINSTNFVAIGNGQFGLAVDGTGLQTFRGLQV
jgi:hypothetical protein